MGVLSNLIARPAKLLIYTYDFKNFITTLINLLNHLNTQQSCYNNINI